jgi:DNA-binding MarR family transcriptional regulator
LKDDSDFRARREKILLRQIVRMFRLMNDETVARMQARGVVGMQPSYPRLLGNLDTEGTRISALSKKMGVTRQAVAQLAREIEAAGFIERLPDPDDGRGVIIAFTPKGRSTLAIAVEVMGGIERDYASVIGDDEMERLKSSLKAILDRYDPPGAFGLD